MSTLSSLRITPRAFGLSVLLGMALIFVAAHPSHAQILPSTISLDAGDYHTTLSAQDLSGWFQIETERTFGQERSEAIDPESCPLLKLYCDFALSRYTRSRVAIVPEVKPDRDSIARFVTTLAAYVDQDPTNAVFGVDNDNHIIVLSPEEQGRALDIDHSTELILQGLAKESTDPLTLTLPTTITAPTLVAADQERLGLHELIGEGHTNFSGSPKNRIYNINRALQQFQNIIIAPGQEFSFVKYLGAVDGEHGYLPELVIKNNKTEPEFGGGICQVSSTVFRAALYSGLKITERRNHAYPVQYYRPYGMDATIYIPKPDLRFINNTPGAILVQSSIDGFNLTFRFFGTKDGRTTTIDGPHILEHNPDGSMKTVFTQEVNDATGKNFIRDSFYSNYKSPSLFPHPGQEPILTEKPRDWSVSQWKSYKALHP